MAEPAITSPQFTSCLPSGSDRAVAFGGAYVRNVHSS